MKETYVSGLLSGGYYNPGYIDGISAGSVSLTAINPILEGTVEGDVLIGQHQRNLAQAGTGANGTQATPDELPLGASLAINLIGGGTVADEVILADTAPELLPAGFNYLTSNFLNGAGPLAAPLSGILPTDAFHLPVITYSTAQLSADGLGSISIKGASRLSMQQDATLTVRPGGSVTLGNATSIDGTIVAHGGTIAISGFQPTAISTNGNPTAYVFPVDYENLVLGGMPRSMSRASGSTTLAPVPRPCSARPSPTADQSC